MNCYVVRSWGVCELLKDKHVYRGALLLKTFHHLLNLSDLIYRKKAFLTCNLTLSKLSLYTIATAIDRPFLVTMTTYLDFLKLEHKTVNFSSRVELP